MTNNLLGYLAIANLAAGAAILIVLVLRKPARALLGARAAYGLWLIVPAAMLATFIPARTVVVVAPALVRAPLQPAIVHAMAPPAIPIHAAPALDLTQVLTALWLAGVAVSLILLAVSQRRALARFGHITPDAHEMYLAHASNSAVGPALFGIFRPRLVLPADFETAFAREEQAMVLAHESAHLAAGHTLINGLVALVRALNWFNPLIQVAPRYARIDQELACDAAVIALYPAWRQTYARAMMKTQITSTPLPLGCYWPERSGPLLEERIEMLARATPGRLRFLSGAAASIVLSMGVAAAVWAAEPLQVKIVPAVASTSDLAASAVGVPAQPKIAVPPSTPSAKHGDSDLVVPANSGLIAAITANDIRGIVQNGGTASDVAMALVANNWVPPNPAFPFDPSTARWVRGANGLEVGFQGPTGGIARFRSADLDAYDPPGGLGSLPTFAEAFGGLDLAVLSAATVVSDGASGSHLELREIDNGTQLTRILNLGDEFSGGWTVAAISPDLLTVRRGDGSRSMIPGSAATYHPTWLGRSPADDPDHPAAVLAR